MPRPQPIQAARSIPTNWRSAVLLTALVLLVSLMACTSDDSNPVGVGLGQAQLDTLMRELVVEDLVHLGQLEVNDPAEPLDEADVLYLGQRDGDASSILINYDFSNLAHPDSLALDTLLTTDNVTSVKLKLLQLLWYLPDHGGLAAESDSLRAWEGAGKVFDVHQLAAPFDTLRYPDVEPPTVSGLISTTSVVEDATSLLLIELDKEVVLQWLRDRARVGLIIKEGVGSEEGLVGFSSKEMTYGGSTLDTDNALTAIGPTLQFNLNRTPDGWDSGRLAYLQWPEADVSTWHELQETPLDPAEGIEVRTHLRSYPVLQFQPGVLPERIRINLAQIVLHVDTTRTHGPAGYLTSSEFPLGLAPDGTRTRVILDDVEDAVELVGGGVVRPESRLETVVRLDVTTTLQRYINGLQDEDSGILIAAGERMFRGYTSSPPPGFYFSRWVFHGTAATDANLRPRLEILYTRVDDLTDGEAAR